MEEQGGGEMWGEGKGCLGRGGGAMWVEGNGWWGGGGGEGLTMQAKINVESQVKPVQERSRLE